MLRLDHKNMEVWKVSMEIVSELYLLTEGFPKAEMFGLRSQLRRESVSITSNLAEGSARKSTIERKRFYEIARSSMVEIDTQIEISLNLKYLDNLDIKTFEVKFIHLFKLLSGLIKNTN